ncbi:hypothetical protein [Candidatus Rickettsia kedanie]|uniref:Toprim domain-containing protein n=1 Tax=Candidatus Rickettsia kedanie TaxID=3115352 RepID=A0ABP9TWB3_9RICK
MINAPTIGFSFSEQGLKKFKENGGVIVATAVEFASRIAAPNLKLDTLKYLSYADQVIFLDENDKKQAIKYQQRHDKHNRALNNKLLESQIINVPSTVPVSDKRPEERGHDIISFGMIKAGKGFAHVRKLAELIKDSPDPLMKDKKILIAGTVQKDKISRDGKNYAHDGELYKLMKDIYPAKSDELHNKNPKELKKLYEKYQQQNIKPALPIELHLDVPKQKLPELFDKCTYSFLPAYRGATLRNSSISSSLANKFITYSHINDQITPTNLKPGGEYSTSMVLQSNDDYNKYAENVFINISSRKHNPKLNKKNLDRNRASEF